MEKHIIQLWRLCLKICLDFWYAINLALARKHFITRLTRYLIQKWELKDIDFSVKVNPLLKTWLRKLSELKEKINIMVSKSDFLRNRVHQLEKLCNDHISNLNEYDREIEALIETVSEIGQISNFNAVSWYELIEIMKSNETNRQKLKK